MEPKTTREFVKLIREHFRLEAEVKTLAAILETAVFLNQPPIGWLNALKVARLQQDYRNISEQFGPQLVQLDAAVDWNELIRVLGNIPPSQFLN